MSNPRRLADYIEEVMGVPCFFHLKSGREGYQTLVTFLRDIDEEKRRYVYDFANKELEFISPSMFAKRSFHLWLFSHPTYEIFTSFLFNAELVEEFISFILMIPRCRKQKNQVKKQRMRQELHRASSLTQLVDPYLELVSKVLDAHHISLGVVNKKTQRNTVPLVSIPPPTEENMRDAHRAFFTQVMRMERQEFTKTPVGSRMSRVTSFLTGVEAIEDEVAARLSELYKLFGVPPTKLKESLVRKVDEKTRDRIYDAMVCGSWVRFKPLTVKACELVVDIPRDEARSIGKTALNVINQRAQDVEFWAEMRDGCLPVGLKIHALKGKLKGVTGYNWSSFKLESAGAKAVLPPVANADAAIDLLEVVEGRVGEQIIDNEEYQIQVCSQSRLTADRAACLGIAFYLGSDRIRTYDERSLVTSHASQTGKRLVIYGAGVCERDFDWCGKGADGVMRVGKTPDEIDCRTDVLWCHSRRDIYNVNLIATILVHDQFDGFWQPLGDMFKHGIRDILEQHQLSGVFDAAWIQEDWGTFDEDDKRFAEAFTELSTYARAEVDRLQSGSVPHTGILKEVDDLLRYCHESVRGEVPW